METTSEEINGTMNISNEMQMGETSEPVKNDRVQPVHNGRKLLVLMKTSSSLQFKSLFECLKELLEEVTIEFIENKGLRLVALDPAKVAMVHLMIDASEYFYAKGKVCAGLHMAFFYKMIRSLSSGDLMEWRIYEDSPNDFEVEISNTERKTETTHKLKLLNLDEIEIIVPSIQFDRVISIPSSDLSKYVKEMGTIGNIINVRATKSTLEFEAVGDMADSKIVIRPTASGLNWKHSEDVPDIEGKFYVKYIEKFCKCSVDATVLMYLKDTLPLILLYDLKIGKLRFCIAPIRANVPTVKTGTKKQKV